MKCILNVSSINEFHSLLRALVLVFYNFLLLSYTALTVYPLSVNNALCNNKIFIIMSMNVKIKLLSIIGWNNNRL